MIYFVRDIKMATIAASHGINVLSLALLGWGGGKKMLNEYYEKVNRSKRHKPLEIYN
ncbi:hypothetical protein C5S29_00260 [ANME-1 cluster archaeon GoMg3.2]|nr:hypothetical protein [ANME-1 cluster archaeon GoMg3.2]